MMWQLPACDENINRTREELCPSAAAFACFDLDFTTGFFHFAFYIGATVLLAYTIGLPLI